MALDESTNAKDVILEIQGIKVVFEKELEPDIKDMVVFYSDKWYNRGFIMKGNAVSSC